MIVRWDGDRPLADAPTLAALYEVSARSVRRHCKVVRYDTDAARGLPGVALYDALTAAEDLAGVAPRPERTAAAIRRRRAGG